MGSVLELPAVVADSWAASIASRLRVVNFSAPNWLTGVLLRVVWRVLVARTAPVGTTVASTCCNAPQVEPIPLKFGKVREKCLTSS